MTATTWHLDSEQIARYASMSLPPSAEASVEAHLEACAACRGAVAGSDEAAHLAARLDRSWAAAAARIDAPRAQGLERLASAVGVSPHLARLLGVSGSFRLAWLTSVALAVVAATGAAWGDLPPALFLLLSPLVPVVGVAAAYAGTGRGGIQPFELATPFGGLRLLLLRATSVTVASLVVLALASVGFADLGPVAAAWLLPSLALTAVTLALSTRITPERAATLVAAGWLVALQVATVVLPRAERPTADDLGALTMPLQLAAIALFLVAAGAFAARRHLVELPER